MRILLTVLVLALLLPGCKDKPKPTVPPPLSPSCAQLVQKLDKCGFHMLQISIEKSCRANRFKDSAYSKAKMKYWAKLSCKSLAEEIQHEIKLRHPKSEKK